MQSIPAPESECAVVRAYVLMDIEGVAGVVHGEEGSRGNHEYERARRLMTDEASAVVRGVVRAAPNAEVMVVDSHGPYRNIIPELLDERATLMRGKPRLAGMMDGIDEEVDFAIFVGVHGKAGAGNSVISHTFTGHLLDVRINGKSCGELELNTYMAGSYDVPVVMVAGDQCVMADARELLGPTVHLVQTKVSRGASAAVGIHPARSCGLLETAAAEATEAWIKSKPIHIHTPVTIDIEFDRPVYADLAELIDGCERVSGRHIHFARDSYQDAYRLLRLLTVLCSTPV